MSGILILDLLLLALLGLTIYFGFKWALEVAEVSRTQVINMTLDDDTTVIDGFLQLLDETESEIIIYDDGDLDPASLYQNPSVVEAIEEKIRTHAGFKVDCVLNECHGLTLFEKELTGHPGVMVRPRASNRSLVHYKIIDRRKAYVSHHRPGAKTRSRKVIDSTNALPKKGEPLALRPHLTDFERYAERPAVT